MAVAEVPSTHGRGDGRVPPYNLEAEESLLGAMLLSKDAIVAASELGVSANDFYKPVHAHVFDAITSLYSAGEPADPVTVAEELRRAGLLGDMGGSGLLVTLQVRTPATSSAARYARIVTEHALLRRLIAVAGEIAEMGYRVPDDVAETVDRAEAMVFDVAQHRVSDSMAPIRDLLDHSLTRLEMLYEKGDSITGIPTGYHGLDELMSGLQPSSLVIVGARPATGKCLTGDTLLTDPRTGGRIALAELYHRGRRGAPVEVTSLGAVDQQLHVRRPSAYVDDGVRPVFKVRTRLGREVCTTAAHPFLTPAGWRPLAEVAVGTTIAVPGQLPIFGHQARPEAEVVVLAYLLSDASHTGASVRFTTNSTAVMADLEHHARALGTDPVRERGPGPSSTCCLTPPGERCSAVVKAMIEHDMVGTGAHHRSAPDAVFELPRPQLALFLNRLLGADGSAWWSNRQGGSACISYCSLSPRLVTDVAHLLLRFGINARVRRRVIDRQGWRGPGHELEVTSVAEIRRLAAEIGMFSKESALANLLQHIGHQQGAQVGAAAVQGGGMAVRQHVVSQHLATVGGRGAAGGAVLTAEAGDDEVGDDEVGDDEVGATHQAVLWEEAAPVVVWDEIMAIDAAGDARVYDLSVPGDHNFVAGDVFVHNTAFALGMAAHAALEANQPVLFFSLEMSHLEITQRLLAAEARVDSTRMRNGKLMETDWTKISHAIGRLAEAPLYIDDNPRATVLEIRAKARRLKSRLGGLGMVVVDYLQLMTGRDRAENRQVEVSEISRGLKVLAREIQTPVVALSQLSRGLELRADKRPMLADLRESGCLTADARVLRADTGAEVTMGELLRTGERDIPVWTLDRHLALVPGTMDRVFPSGAKQVYELRLASGRRVKASANHPFLAATGWLRLDELRLGTRIATPRRLPPPAQLRSWVDEEVASAAAQLTWEVTGCSSPSVELRQVPGPVFSLPHHQLVGFVRRFWPSTSYRVDQQGRLVPRLASSSRGLLDEVQLLLLRLEIHCRVTWNAQTGTAHLHIDGDESRSRFLHLMGGAAPLRAASPGHDLPPSRARSAPASVLASALVGGGPAPLAATDGGPPGADRLSRLARVAALLDDPELDRRARADVAWDAVVAVDALGQEPVYDACVPETHNFVANGIVVENSLEQDADVVIFLYRDELYHPESPDRGTAEVLVAKHRSGPTGMERLAFLDRYTRFANMAKGI